MAAKGNRGRYRCKGRPPNGPGVYRHKNKRTGTIDRVGEGSNIRSRLNDHKRKGRPFANTKTHQPQWKSMDGRSTSRTRRKVESKQIRKHKPKYAKRAGGGGRPARGGSGRRRSSD